MNQQAHAPGTRLELQARAFSALGLSTNPQYRDHFQWICASCYREKPGQLWGFFRRKKGNKFQGEDCSSVWRNFFRKESKEQILRGRLFVSLKDFFRREKRPNSLVDVIPQFKVFWGNRKKPTFCQYEDFKDWEVLQCGSDAGLDLDQRWLHVSLILVKMYSK